MLTIAHIIQPTVVKPISDLYRAQPITFETMKIAQLFVQGEMDVSLFAIQLHGENEIPLPNCFTKLSPITRSIIDLKCFRKKRKLPLIKDILDPLYSASQADYFIYTNVDIALQPNFYWTVAKIIEQGHDAFIINRRTIPDNYSSLDELPLMYSEIGEKHKGWDCFIFKRKLYSQFEFGMACIGTGWIGRVLIVNMATFADDFKVFPDLHLTFHIGNEKSWKTDTYNDYLLHNKEQCSKIMTGFEKKMGKFDRSKLPGRFLTLIEKDGFV
jgi:hypothetical protein